MGIIQQMKAIPPGHPDVGQDHPIEALRNTIFRRHEGACRNGAHIRQFQRLAERLAHGGIVVHQQYVAGHAASAAGSVRSSVTEKTAPVPVLAPRIWPPKLCTIP